MNLFLDGRLLYGINLESVSCYASLDPTRRLVTDTGVPVLIVPMISELGNVASDGDKSNDPLADYKARRAKARRENNQREQDRLCALLDIDASLGSLEYNAQAASLGLVHLAINSAPPEECWEYVDQVYRAAFRDGEPIDSLEKVQSLVDLDVAACESALQEISDSMGEEGLFSSPAYWVDGERFHGRQHLPLMRWIMTGRSGSPPV